MAGLDTSNAKITESRLEEALDVRDRMIIELLIQVLDEKLVIEKPVLRERLTNFNLLADRDAELKDTIQALINNIK
jgi:hypothetical protein